MQSEFYKAYMKSQKWEQLREQRKRMDGFKCALCGISEYQTKLEVHHVSYANLGHEDVGNDLVTVCDRCHVLLHRYYSRRRH